MRILEQVDAILVRERSTLSNKIDDCSTCEAIKGKSKNRKQIKNSSKERKSASWRHAVGGDSGAEIGQVAHEVFLQCTKRE